MKMCYIHHGPYKAVDGMEGCQDKGCLKLRKKKLKPYYPKDPAVPGGAHEKVSPKKRSKEKGSQEKSSTEKGSKEKGSQERP